MFNVFGMMLELKAAGIQFSGCNTDGKVWDVDGTTEIQVRPDVAAVLSAHNPAAWVSRERRVAERETAARVAAKNIPNWSTWTPAQFQAWCDANLITDAQIDATTLSAALKMNIKANNAFTRNAGLMIIAMRDRLWADLPE